MNFKVKSENGCFFRSSSLDWFNPSGRLSERPVGTFGTESHPLRSHCKYFCAHPAGLLSSRPKGGRRESTYNCSEKLSYIWRIDGKQKRLIKKLVHFCMIDGKRTKSRVIVSQTFSRLFRTKPDVHVITLLANAIGNVKPTCEVKRVRIAGTTHNVPKIIAKERQETLAFRWIMEAAVKRRTMSGNSQSLDQCLSAEILDAYQRKGNVRKRRDDLHKLAEANKSFAHYRWW